MEIRIQNLSLGADFDIPVGTNPDAPKLPTVTNHIKSTYGKSLTKTQLVRKPILQNINAVFRPGTMTLVLGQPGSGKSAFLKLLSGRFPETKNIVVEGNVTYNGIPRERLLKRLPQCVSYVSQEDTHFPSLTAKETLEFANTCSGGTETSGKNRKDGVSLVDSIIHRLGLENCQDTPVGDAMLRGLSGGERKRVTLGEMMAYGRTQVDLLDEITNGLDSSTAFDIVSGLKKSAVASQKTYVLTLKQPAPEVFALFDNVIVLSEGRMIFNGAIDKAMTYFEGIGFKKPSNRDTADFLADLATDYQLQYHHPKPASIIPRTSTEFAAVYDRSSLYRQIVATLNSTFELDSRTDNLLNTPQFQSSFMASVSALIKRQLLVTFRNKALLKGKVVLTLIMALLYSFTFYNVDFRDIVMVVGISFYACLYLALGNIPNLPLYYASREIFYKQRRANFYRTGAYAIAAGTAQLPLAFLESVVFGSFLYWLSGFLPDVVAFAKFIAILFMSNITFSGLYFAVANLTPNINVGKPLCLVYLLFCILFSGFVLPRSQISDYIVWIYYANPLAWALKSVAISQYRFGIYSECVYKTVDYCEKYGANSMGEYYLRFFDIPTDESIVLYGTALNAGIYVFYMFLAFLILEYKRLETPASIVLPKIPGSKRETNNDRFQPISTPGAQNQVEGNSAVQSHAVSVGADRHFQPVTLAFENLWYSVPNPSNKGERIDLLKGVTGYALPGKMTALMGATGAGKTTLMDVIAGRKAGGNGIVKGKILLNGFEANPLAIRRATGYCEQMDIHSDASTIREALVFSALLRQSSAVSTAQKMESVEEALSLLQLHPIADRVIRGCSSEQMKRLTVAVELVAEPSIIFLDEPTTGLDARAAKLTMESVRRVADTGRTVLCTIHQPSAEVFGLFDSLLLLKRGGETVYFGGLDNNCHSLVTYFEQLDSNIPHLPEGANPATWMLDIIGGRAEDSDCEEAKRDSLIIPNSTAALALASIDFVKEFQSSQHCQQLSDIMQCEGVGFPSADKNSEIKFNYKRAASSFLQMRLVTGRYFSFMWRTPTYTWTRFAVSIFMGLLFGGVFYDSEFLTFQGINGGLGMVYCTECFVNIVALASTIPIASHDRAAFYRERASETYNSFWYFFAWTIVEIPLALVTNAPYAFIFYYLAGFSNISNAVVYWLMVSFHVSLAAYMGQLFAFISPSVEAATLLSVLHNAIFVLFTGFSPPQAQLPNYFSWLRFGSIFRYPFVLLSAFLLGECSNDQLSKVMEAQIHGTDLNMSQLPNGCQLIENAPPNVAELGQGFKVPVKTFLENDFDLRYEDIQHYLLVMLGIMVFIRFLALLALRFLNHQKK